MNVNVRRTIAGMTRLGSRMDGAVADFVAESAAFAQEMIREFAPVGAPNNSTNPPGDLKKSVEIARTAISEHEHHAVIGPTVKTVRPGPGGTVLNYARIREWPSPTVIRPRVSPLLVFTVPTATGQALVATPSVTQTGTGYTKRAYDIWRPQQHGTLAHYATQAILGR